MLRSLKDFLDSLSPRAEPAQSPEHRLHLAAAVLLVEVMRSDRQVSDNERTAALLALRQQFGLVEDEVARLAELAEQAARDAHDFYAFTSQINEAFDFEQKVRMIEDLWRVAYADAHLSADEHHVIRKIADLLHVPHGAYISAKMRAKAATGQR